MELRRTAICHECLNLLRRPKRNPRSPLLAPIHHQTNRRPISAKAHNERLRANAKASPKPSGQFTTPVLDSLFLAARTANYTVSSQDLNDLHRRILDLSESALQSDAGKLPDEQRLLYVLEQFEALAQTLIDGHTAESLKNASNGTQTNPTDPTAAKTSTSQSEDSMSATSALLGSVNSRSYPAFITKAAVLHLISEKAESLLRHPHVFITPALLKAYVHLQSLLHQPASFPDIFDLYAHKPIPVPGGGSNPDKNQPTITFKPARPTNPSAAIPTPTASLALTTAITTHSLLLSLSIINTTFSTPAYRRSKTLQHLLLPGSLLTVSPLAAYTLSTSFSSWQNTMDPTYATGVAFAGICTYVASVCSIGYVAITTANDQMQRVTWAQGVPLWERWVREEERAALDRVALAWGFEGTERRGEEVGWEWEVLREEVGLRGCVLDRSELMEGME
ncbi:hypothetical protein KC343_g8751 [Hortaea werneckii]|nr:hypothetical protein KC323_g9367 [Hortaea werneckii]KAI6854173.1 hypothetical protein KC338_g9349 [Hortaea werneckii]KAI7619340.1 hypothetical protein KC343_g8751 [Hortaea werneckii]KAI7660540.1 hypothetical protein KC319_g8632 [Hortaea werneckii]